MSRLLKKIIEIPVSVVIKGCNGICDEFLNAIGHNGRGFYLKTGNSFINDELSDIITKIFK